MADEDSIKLAAAELLLDRGVRFTITDAPFFLRILSLNRIRIKALRGGTIAEISRIMSRDEMLDIKEVSEANAKMDSIALVVAIAILNGDKRIRIFSKQLASFLLWKVNPLTLFQIYLIIASVNKISAFMTITEYFSHLTKVMMSPRIPGQTVMGS